MSVSTASAPIRVDRIRSKALAAPPLCTCPNTVTLVSIPSLVVITLNTKLCYQKL